VKFLLTGCNGQVGWELQRALAPLGDVIATDRTLLDLADLDSVRRVVREVKPDTIVNAAAYTAVDKAESEPSLAMRVNGEAPGVLAEEAKRLGALLVHYSTDFVFDGRKRTPYTESDPPNPINEYGRSKLAGERAVVSVAPAHLVLRVAWVYGARGRNFVKTIIASAVAGKPLRVVDDQIGTPTWSRTIAEATAALIEKGKGRTQGLYHLSAVGETSRFELASRIVQLRGLACSVTPVASDAFPSPAERPLYSVLGVAKLQSEVEVVLPHWDAALQSCLREEEAP